ncbi:MAG: methyltransferase domain-containing protein [Candidatus Pacebacteria bacterium]|nr:methyltransferase domain-containing protein [Candidatus Paceibacterota bacterium]
MSTDEKTLDWYQKRAEKYTNHVRNPDDAVYHSYYEKPAMYALLPDLKGKTVLSVGCGSGEDSNYLKNQGATKSVGIDLSSELIKIASQTYPNCEFKTMDMEKLEFADQSFDFAYSSLAIHYIENWTQSLSEVYRVLKPGSHFIFSCNHPVRFAAEVVENEDHEIYKVEVFKNKITKEATIIGDYLNKNKIVDVFGENTVNFWHVPMGEISKCIYEAGFLIEQIVEPLPKERMKELRPETYKRLQKIPEFIIFKLLKR